MKIISLNTKQIYELDISKSGENTLKCPECSGSRKKKNTKPFRWNNDKLVGHCYHCETSFVEYKPYKVEKKYTIPEWKNITKLSDKAVNWFNGRMISQNTLNKMKIYSDDIFIPAIEKVVESICFPYFFNDKLINIKYRGPQKSFTQVIGAELVFWNIDCISKFDSVIIVEGEIDLLSFIEIGFENVISVPAGASGKEMLFIDNYFDLFNGKKIIIAVDNDIKGSELKNELIRRFGSENCLITCFEDCKDANEILCEKGGNKLREIIENAKEIPVSGIVDISDNYDEIYNLYTNGLEKGKTIGIKEIDDKVTWELGRLAVWTGIPSHGKSSIVDLINVLLNIKFNWKVAYFSPESYPVKYHFARIYSLIQGKQFIHHGIGNDEFELLFEYIHNNFFFIYPEDNFRLETILEKANYLVKKKGINILTIDPYNNLEQTKNKGEADTEYIGRILFELTKFGKKNNCLVHLVAHPTKMKKQLSGLYEKPNLYDINGSANFYNKCDYGFSIYRYFGADAKIDFDVLKVKWKHLGEGGSSSFNYNYNNGRLENHFLDVNGWDNSNWLLKKPENKLPIQSEMEMKPNKTDWYDKENKEFDNYMPDGIEAEF
jgi:twinkle protein